MPNVLNKTEKLLPELSGRPIAADQQPLAEAAPVMGGLASTAAIHQVAPPAPVTGGQAPTAASHMDAGQQTGLEPDSTLGCTI